MKAALRAIFPGMKLKLSMRQLVQPSLASPMCGSGVVGRKDGRTDGQTAATVSVCTQLALRLVLHRTWDHRGRELNPGTLKWYGFSPLHSFCRLVMTVRLAVHVPRVLCVSSPKHPSSLKGGMSGHGGVSVHVRIRYRRARLEIWQCRPSVRATERVSE